MSKYGMWFRFVNYVWCLADLLTAYLHTDWYLIMMYYILNEPQMYTEPL